MTTTTTVGEISPNYIAKATTLMAKAKQFTVVTNDEELARASECEAQIGKVVKALDDERLEMGKGARDTLAKINTKWNAKINELKELRVIPRKAVVDYTVARERAEAAEREAARAAAAKVQRDAERAAKEAQEKAAAAARKRNANTKAVANAEAEAAAARAAEEAERAARAAARSAEMANEASTRSTTGTLGSKSTVVDNWKFRVVDISKVPDAYVTRVANEKVLKALAGPDANVPGVEFYNEPYTRRTR